MHLNLPDFSTLTLKYPLARFFFTTHTNSYDLWRSTGHKSQLTFSCFRPILLPSSMTSAMENQYWVSKIRMFFAKNLPVLKEILHTFWNGGIWQWQKWLNSNFPDHFIVSKIKRFMSVFCKRRGADGSFSIPHLMHFCILTFHLFWVNTPLCQGRAALLCSKIARQISHENEWFEIFFCIFVIHFWIGTSFITNLYT